MDAIQNTQSTSVDTDTLVRDYPRLCEECLTPTRTSLPRLSTIHGHRYLHCYISGILHEENGRVTGGVGFHVPGTLNGNAAICGDEQHRVRATLLSVIFVLTVPEMNQRNLLLHQASNRHDL